MDRIVSRRLRLLRVAGKTQPWSPPRQFSDNCDGLGRLVEAWAIGVPPAAHDRGLKTKHDHLGPPEAVSVECYIYIYYIMCDSGWNHTGSPLPTKLLPQPKRKSPSKRPRPFSLVLLCPLPRALSQRLLALYELLRMLGADSNCRFMRRFLLDQIHTRSVFLFDMNRLLHS